MHEARVLLDTFALLWLTTESTVLSDTARDAIEHASIVYVSAISAWEISLKAARGGITLPLPANEWFNLALEQHKLTLAPLEVDVLIAANALPWHHRDPADRFIVATAQKLGCSIVTSDRAFAAYDVTLVS